MKLKRILCVLLALLMLLACVACDNRPPVDDPDGEQPTPQNKDAVTIAASGASEYKLIRADTAKQTIKDAFTSMYTAVQEKTGARLTMDTDWAELGDKEILIGNTNREESASALQDLQDLQAMGEIDGESFLICVKGQKLVIVGTSDESTARGVQYCIDHYLTVSEGNWSVSKSLEFAISITHLLLIEDTEGSLLKKQYSDYVDTYTETQLLSFDELDMDGMMVLEEHELDETYQIEGSGALRFTISGDDKQLTRLMWENGTAFSFSAADKNKTTLKFWLFVDDTDKVVCDHDDVYGDRQEGQATFYFRVFDDKGRVFNWNHTLTGDGWHEIELTFNTHNGVDANFNYENIVSFGVLVAADQGTMIEFDDLRAVHYETDHVPEEAPDGGRLITDGEYDAFDGAIIQEWYGASYDLEDKVFGNSSLRCEGDASVTDFRTVVSNLAIPLNYQNDVLIFWMKVEDLSTIDSIFIELNQAQDQHEYQKSFSKANLQSYGLSTEDDKWCKITIPLSAFEKNLDADTFGEDENITMCAFRFVVSAHGNKTYVVHLDRAYLTTKDAEG